MTKTEYMREYMRRRYHERRKQALEYLGGKCVVCGTKKRLEIDHRDPKTKTYEVDQVRSLSEAKFWKEIEKCQLLCKKHHIEKTIIDVGKKPARGTHGTLSSYRYCKCDLCRAAYNTWRRAHRKPRPVSPHGGEPLS